METITTTATAPPAPYSHIVNGPDKVVDHGFSLSGWDKSKRHAATRHRGMKYLTLCSKSMEIDPEYKDTPFGERAAGSEGIDKDRKNITCNACRKKLSLLPLTRR